MLDPGTCAPFAGVRGLIDLNLSLPSSIPGILILAAFGAIAGLYFFFHGFSLLQQRARIAGRSHVQRPAHNATISSTSTFATEDSSTLKVDSHHEVIQLSSSESPQADSASMTQQGKIA